MERRPILLIVSRTPRSCSTVARRRTRSMKRPPPAKRWRIFPRRRADRFARWMAASQLTPDEIAGRNTWMLWTGGNEAFWDYMARNGYGLIDFLKVIDSRQRPERFSKFGLDQRAGLPGGDQAGRVRPLHRSADFAAAGRDQSGSRRQVDRHHRLPPFPQSEFRRGGAEEVGCETLLHGSLIFPGSETR